MEYHSLCPRQAAISSVWVENCLNWSVNKRRVRLSSSVAPLFLAWKRGGGHLELKTGHPFGPHAWFWVPRDGAPRLCMRSQGPGRTEVIVWRRVLGSCLIAAGLRWLATCLFLLLSPRGLLYLSWPSRTLSTGEEPWRDGWTSSTLVVCYWLDSPWTIFIPGKLASVSMCDRERGRERACKPFILSYVTGSYKYSIEIKWVRWWTSFQLWIWWIAAAQRLFGFTWVLSKLDKSTLKSMTPLKYSEGCVQMAPLSLVSPKKERKKYKIQIVADSRKHLPPPQASASDSKFKSTDRKLLEIFFL